MNSEYSVEFRFKMGQTVKIAETGMSATVVGRLQNFHGHQYQLVYWANSIRYDQWVYGREIEYA